MKWNVCTDDYTTVGVFDTGLMQPAKVIIRKHLFHYLLSAHYTTKRLGIPSLPTLSLSRRFYLSLAASNYDAAIQ